jgi:hypothetical protein
MATQIEIVFFYSFLEPPLLPSASRSASGDPRASEPLRRGGSSFSMTMQPKRLVKLAKGDIVGFEIDARVRQHHTGPGRMNGGLSSKI